MGNSESSEVVKEASLEKQGTKIKLIELKEIFAQYLGTEDEPYLGPCLEIFSYIPVAINYRYYILGCGDNDLIQRVIVESCNFIKTSSSFYQHLRMVNVKKCHTLIVSQEKYDEICRIRDNINSLSVWKTK